MIIFTGRVEAPMAKRQGSKTGSAPQLAKQVEIAARIESGRVSFIRPPYHSDWPLFHRVRQAARQLSGGESKSVFEPPMKTGTSKGRNKIAGPIEVLFSPQS